MCATKSACFGTISFVALVVACDPEGSSNTAVDDTSDVLSTDPSVGELIYEDGLDAAILNDRANLRSSGTSDLDHARVLQHASLVELQVQLPDYELPSASELEGLELRWFDSGTGIVAQNHSGRAFGILGLFTRADAPNCRVMVAWRPVGPSQSALLVPSTDSCVPDQAQVHVRDEFGFAVDSRDLDATESRR